MQVMFAVRMRLGRSRSGPAWTCTEDLRVRTRSVAARSARPPRSYRVRHRRLELWTPPQERRGLCQASDTRMWLNARKVEDETSSVFAREHPVGKVECLAFQRAIPRLLNGESNHEAVRTPDLESRSPTLFLGRAWRTVESPTGRVEGARREASDGGLASLRWTARRRRRDVRLLKTSSQHSCSLGSLDRTPATDFEEASGAARAAPGIPVHCQ
jgi:hypothetical protein